jgi:hypothetical protein
MESIAALLPYLIDPVGTSIIVIVFGSVVYLYKRNQ